MKNITYAILAVLLFSSCEKWLAISPKSEISSEELFKSEQGFKDALIGSYLLLTSKSSYGFEGTIGFLDGLAQQYPAAGTNHPYYYTVGYQYEHASVLNKKDNMWVANYSAIANLNNIINTIDVEAPKLNPAHTSLIKGEALGLRAFVHLDLYRLFGYGNLAADPEGLNKVNLPYVDKYSKNVTAPVSGLEYLQKVERDLLQAESLLAKYDSVSVAKNLSLGVEIPNGDKFYDNRRMRFNYYAVKATQARLYLWMGDYEKAKQAAEHVIRDGRRNLVSFHNGNINDPNPINKDYTFSTEHIFALNVQNMYEYNKPYIDQYGPDGLNVNNLKLAHSGTVANELYEINSKDGMSLSDYRYKELYKKVSQTEYLLLKFTYVSNSAYYDRMPIIKLPEMYYILAECHNELGDVSAAVNQLNTVRVSRGIASSYNLSPSLSKEQVQAEIQREYRKEFVSEGQLFYYFKRRGNKNIPNTAKAMDNSVYILPLPQRELEMGNNG